MHSGYNNLFGSYNKLNKNGVFQKRIFRGCQNTCLLKHEIALYKESTEAVCGSQIAFHPFCFTYILLHIRQLLTQNTLLLTLCVLFMYIIMCILCLNIYIYMKTIIVII